MKIDSEVFWQILTKPGAFNFKQTLARWENEMSAKISETDRQIDGRYQTSDIKFETEA